MGTLWTPQDSSDRDEDQAVSGRGRLSRIQQSASLVYLAGGIILICQYWSPPKRWFFLPAGTLIFVYGLFRLYLSRRAAGRN